MTSAEFTDLIKPLAAYLGVILSREQIDIYFDRFQNVPKSLLKKAIDILVDNSERRQFPLVSDFWTAIEGAQGKAPQGNQPVEDHDFCQKCNNSGLFLEDNTAHFCVCRKGRYRQAAWGIPTDIKPAKKEDLIEKAMRKLPHAELPVRGLKEKNELGFWEDTQEQHDLWMAKKRKELAELTIRTDAFEEKRRLGKKTVSPEGLKRIVEETMNQVKESQEKKFDLDEIPF